MKKMHFQNANLARKKPKRRKALCIIDRLFPNNGEVCLFVYDFDVYFNNNQAKKHSKY